MKYKDKIKQMHCKIKPEVLLFFMQICNKKIRCTVFSTPDIDIYFIKLITFSKYFWVRSIL